MKRQASGPKSMATAATPVKFELTAPAAKSVAVAGTFSDWQPNRHFLRRNGGGVWTAIIPLLPGHYEYRFVVDGEWRDDPACAERVRNPFGSQNCVRDVLCQQAQVSRIDPESAHAL